MLSLQHFLLTLPISYHSRFIRQRSEAPVVSIPSLRVDQMAPVIRPKSARGDSAKWSLRLSWGTLTTRWDTSFRSCLQSHLCTHEQDRDILANPLLFQGYRTGYVYKQPLVKEEPPKPKDEKVELPPAVSSLGYLLEEENFYKDG